MGKQQSVVQQNPRDELMVLKGKKKQDARERRKEALAQARERVIPDTLERFSKKYFEDDEVWHTLNPKMKEELAIIFERKSKKSMLFTTSVMLASFGTFALSGATFLFVVLGTIVSLCVFLFFEVVFEEVFGVDIFRRIMFLCARRRLRKVARLEKKQKALAAKTAQIANSSP